MKKVLQIGVIATLSPVLFAVPVAAQSNIDNTGPGSNNTVTNTVQRDCTFVNNNNITISGDNTQYAVSGDATTDGNTQTYGAVTGGASNSNSTVVSISITNNGDGSIKCVAQVAVTEPAPGVGAGTPVAEAQPAAKPASLPKTSSASPLAVIGVGLVAVAVLALVTRGAVAIQAARK